MADVVAFLDSISLDNFKGDEAARAKVRAAVRRLSTRVDYPFEQATALCLEWPLTTAAVETCIDMGLWKAWLTEGGGTERNLDELVKMLPVACETNLLRQYL